MLAPRGARHPYLLWTALPVLSVSAWEIYSAPPSSSSSPTTKGKSVRTGGHWGSGSEDEDGWRDVADAEAAAAGGINGESVRDSLLEFEQEKLVKGAVYGAAFIVGLVGIWVSLLATLF